MSLYETRNLVVRKVRAPVDIEISSESLLGNLSISNVKVERVIAPAYVRGNLDLTNNIESANIVVTTMDAPMPIRGNVDAMGDFTKGAAVFKRISNSVNVFGNVGSEIRASVGNVRVSSTLAPVQIYGNVVLVGENSKASMGVYSVTEPVRVLGNVFPEKDQIAYFVASNFPFPDATTGNVEVSSSAVVSNAIVTRVHGSSNVSGVLVATSGMTLSNSVAANFSSNVPIYGNLEIDPFADQDLEIGVSKVVEPTEIIGNVYMHAVNLGNSNFSNVLIPVSIVGNVGPIDWFDVSNVTINAVNSPVTVEGVVQHEGVVAQVDVRAIAFDGPVPVRGNIGMGGKEGTLDVRKVLDYVGISGDLTSRNTVDGMGRQRAEFPISVFEIKFDSRAGDTRVSTLETGSGVITSSRNGVSVLVGTDSGEGRAVLQTRRRATYQTGIATLAIIGFDFDDYVEGSAVQSVGLYDDYNGFFARVDSSGVSLVHRSTATGGAKDNVIPRSNWNVDPLNGLGRSGVHIDLSTPQALFVDMASVGVGKVRVGFVVDGYGFVAHIFRSSDGYDYVPILGNSTLPVRWESTSSGYLSSRKNVEAFGCSVVTEGGAISKGLRSSVESFVLAQPFETREILALRVRKEFASFATLVVGRISLLTSSGVKWKVVLNATASTEGEWSDASNFIEKNTTRSVDSETGQVVSSGYCGAASSSHAFEITDAIAGTSVEGDPDVVSVIIEGYNDYEDYWLFTMSVLEII